jgi:hypothetical protein
VEIRSMFARGIRPTDGSSLGNGSRRSPKGQKTASGGIPRRRGKHAFRPGGHRQGFEFLETRQLLSVDLTQEIVNLLDDHSTTASVTLNDVTLGSFLTANSVMVSFQNISQQGSDWSGTVSVSADTASITIGQDFSGQIQGDGTAGSVGLSGSYSLSDRPADQGSYQLSVTSLTASVPNVLNATASDVQLQFDPAGSSTQQLAHVGSLSATIIPFENTQVSLSNLDIFENGFTLADASVSARSFTLGSFLTVDDPSVSFSNVAYTDGAALAGTLSIGVGTATLFPNKSAFTATVHKFTGSYDLNSGELTLGADDAKLAIGQILAADASGLTFDYNPSASPSLTVASATIDVQSPDFPGIDATATNFTASSAGFSLASVKLTAPSSVTLGGFLKADGLYVEADNLDYQTSPPAGQPALSGTITVGASSVSLFSNSSVFTTSVTGFTGSYELTSGALSLSASEVDINVGSVLEVKAETIGFSLTPDGTGVDVSISVGSATAKLPKLNLSGDVEGLSITNDGFMVGSAGLAYMGTVQYGSLFSIKDPSVQISNFGYSFSKGASFNSNLKVNADEIDLNQGGSASVSATGITSTLSFQTGDIGHFTFSADTVNVQLGSFLTLKGSNISFDSDPAAGGDIASFGSVTATVTAGSVSISGTGQDFAIGADGSFIEGSNFGVSLSLADSSTLDWPSWLPIQITTLALTWPDFSSDPTNFSIDLSASIDINLDNSGLMFSGSVTDAVIDVDLLKAGQFPITSIGGFSVSASGDLFGAKVSGTLIAGIVAVDSSGNVVPAGSSTPVANRYLYGGVEASLDLAGLGGFTVMLGLSQLGPLDAFVEADVPILLDPDSGLALTGLYAGIQFDTTLPALTDAHQLVNNPALTPLNQLTVQQWQDQLASQVATQAQQAAQGASSFNVLSEPMVIEGGATIYDEYASTYAFTLTAGILFDTTGKIEATGKLTIGDSVSLQGAVYVDLSNVTSGHVEILTYLQFPSQAPIATVYGSLGIDVTGTASDPATSFTINVSGEVDLTLPDLPGALQIIGSASFTASTKEASFDFSLNGQVNLDPVGNLISLYGKVHFDDAGGTPELYGVFVLTTGDLSELEKLGLDLSGTAVLEFNTTGQSQSEDITLTGATTPTAYTPPANSVSLAVTGQASFEINGNTLFSIEDLNLQAYFSLTTDSSGDVHPLLQIYLAGTIDIGPTNSPYLQFSTADFLQASDSGLAAQFNITLKSSATLASAGIDLHDDTFTFLLNTTDQDVSYVPRSITNPAQPGTGTAVDVPAAPSGSITPQPYFEVDGKGGLTIENSFDVEGSFSLVVAQSGLLFSLDGVFSLEAGGTTLLSFDANGGVSITSQGIVAGLSLKPVTALPSGLGFSLNASFLLEANTTGQAETLGGVAVPADPQGVTGPYALVQATGDLSVGSFDVNGSFYFLVDSSKLQLQFQAAAALGPLGQAAIDGDLVIGSNNGSSVGIYGILQAALLTSPNIPDISLSLQFQFEINTTNLTQTVTGFSVDPTTGNITTGRQIAIPSNFIEIDAGGQLSIVNMFNVAGEFDFTLSASGLQLSANATLTGFFGINLGLHAQLGIFSADSQGSGGLVVDAGLTLNGSLPLGLLSISASPEIIINTSNATRDGIAANTYEVELNHADVNFLGLQASGSLIVGVSDGVFEIDVPSSDPLQLSFFGLGGVSISGYIDSNRQFSLTGSVGFQLGQSGNEIWGSLQITISNNGFSGYFGGGCQIFGINLASISGWLTIDNGYIDLGASVSVWIFSFSFNIGIGQLQQPQHAPNSLLFYSVPTSALAGGTASLDASATDGSGNVAADSAYNWTVYYGGNVYSQKTGANPSLKLGDPGTYTVVMNEGSVSKTSTIQVADVAPTVSSLNLQTGYADGQSVTLAPSVYSPLPEAPGGLHYQWTILKDGQPFATATTPTFAFTPATPGMTSYGAPVPDVYQVSYTVSDNYGGAASATGTFGTFDPNNIVVTTTQDLTQPGAVTSLRVAIQEAASVPGVHYVKFAADLAGQTITLTQIGDSTDYGNSAIRLPSGSFVLDASNAPGVTIAASGAMRIFYVPSGTTLELMDLNLSNGLEYGNGAGSYGGAIYTDGAVYVSNSAFINNRVFGVYLGFAGGGAVYVSTSGLLSAVETTFGNNVVGSVYAYGGAIDTAGALLLEHVTIAGNSVSGTYLYGGGVYDTASNQPNPVTPGGSPIPLFTVLSNALIAQNSGGVDFDYEGNSGGQINSALIGTSANIPSVIFQLNAYSKFIQGVNPLLGPLADHGDGVYTFSLLPGSPALNIGIGPYENYLLDGRGYPFPPYGSDSIGAFQSQPYVVSNTNDSGPGSLRAAITEDDSSLPITFAPNLVGQVISLSGGPITITHNLTIQGLGANEIQVVSGTVAPLPTDVWAGEGNTQDSSGAAPGYPVGTVSYTQGIVGQAFQLNGTNAVTIPDNQTLDSSTFTIGGWYKISQAQNSILASKYGGGAYYNGWILGLISSNQPYFEVLASPTSTIVLTSPVALSLNSWHYIAASYDGNNVELYVDGKAVAGGTLPGGYTPSALPLEIGGASWYPAGYTIGSIDQFAFYDTSLTANQITATYDATLSLSQPAYQGYGIFHVAGGVTVSITGLTLGNGDAVNGGAINNTGNVTITGSQFVQDSAPAAPASGKAGNAYGGAIYNGPGGVVVVTDSLFINDAALGGEGQASGTTAGTGGNAYGGAIYNAAGALLGAADDTFAGDYATGGTGDGTASTKGEAGAGFGGAIYNAGTAYLVNLTVARNAVSNGVGLAPTIGSDGAGLSNQPGAILFLSNSIVADNTGDDIIVGGQVVAQSTGGNDLVNQGTTSGQNDLVTSNLGLPGSLIASTADPNLAQLLNTGGTTSTLVPLPGSPAIDQGNNAVTGLPVFPFSIPGLLAWWQASGSGQDTVGSANATLQGGATYGPGISGQAFQFNGTTSFVAIPPSADIVGTGGFSVSVWIKTTSASGVIIQQRDANNFNGEYQVALAGGKVVFAVFGNSEYDVNMSSNASVTDGNWHNIVVVRQPNGTGEIFIDGNLDSAQAGPDVALGSGFNIYLGADERDVYYGLSAIPFTGLIDEVAIFNTALTSANVQAIAQGTISAQATDQRGDPRIYNGTVDIGAVESQPYVVTNTNDSGPGSLRQAVASDAAGDQMVTFAPTLAGQTITLTSGPITIKNNLVLIGPGAPSLTISGGGSSQIFIINSGNVSISGLTFSNGFAAQGGAIYNGGNLTIANSVFTNNIAQNNPSLNSKFDSAGGAIDNAPGATLVVTGSTFAHNQVIGAAGPSNNANAYGGAIENAAGAIFNGTNDTFTGNTVQGGAVYGTDGYNIINDQSVNPSYASTAFSAAYPYIWSSSTTDPRALEKADSGATDRIAGTAYSNTSFTLNVKITDGKAHNFTLYALDFDSNARSEIIQVENAATGAVLDTRTISSFHNGVYLTWTISGNINFVVTAVSSNAVIAGYFFDPAPAGATGPATFVGMNTTNLGNWRGTAAGGGFGGAIDNAGTATLLDSTIDGDSVGSGTGAAPTPSEGAGINNQAGGTLALTNTIVADDTGGHDVAGKGTVTGNHNLVMTSTGVSAGVISVTTDPKLGPLGSNGGPTPTQALLAGSPAINAGNPVGSPATDQRGFARFAGATVDIGADEYNAPVVVSSTADSGAGSLRAALALAATLSGSTVSFANTLTGATITLASPLILAANVTIDGTNAPGLVLSGGLATEVFSVSSGVTAVIQDLSIDNGVAIQGGGISNAGTLSVTNVQFASDTARGNPLTGIGTTGQGGAIYNAPGAILTVTGSTFSGDSASGGEGFTITAYGAAGGTAAGGAISNSAGALLSAVNDTFTADRALGGTGDNGYLFSGSSGIGLGGAIFNAGSASFANVTIDGNSVSSGGGVVSTPSDGAGIFNQAGATLDLFNSIVAQNTGGHDIANSGSALGRANLVSTSTGAPSSLVQSTANPNLAPLAGTGGWTPTQVPKSGSPAIDSGSNSLLASAVTTIPGLVDLWQGNGNAQDSAGAASGTITGGVTFAAGVSGQAFQFNGTSGYVTLGTSPDIVGTGGLSISVWIKTTSASGVIIQQRDVNNFNGEYWVALAGGKVVFAVFGNSEYDVNMTSNASVSDGNWHNIVVVRQPNGTGQIFIDGKLDSALAGPDVPLGSGFNVYLGADERDAYYLSAPDYFTGLMENVALFNRAFSAMDVQTLNSGSGAVTTDQRGFARINNGTVDLGAVETQPYVVTNTNDSGPGSLRAAVTEDNTSAPINFAASLAGNTITLSTELDITNSLTLDGTAVPGLSISGGGATRVIDVAPGATVTLRGLSIENGSASTGGGILVDATATLTLSGVTVAGNTATGNGGGIENLGTLSIVDSTIANNAAGSTTGNGGGLDTSGSLTLLDSTIAGNSAGKDGGGIAVEKGTITARDTIIATNFAPAGPDILGGLGSLGHNLIGNTSGATGLASSDLTGVNPKLGTLQNNGGPTPTLALLSGSPAIDAGDATGAPATDQRGDARIVNGVIDIGAYELQVQPPSADAGDGYTVNVGDSVTFNAGDSSSPQGLPLSYSWDLNGDGVFGDATDVEPTLTWAQLEALGIHEGATYSVKVQVNDGYGGIHLVTSAATSLTVLPELQLTAVALPSPSTDFNTAIDSVQVTFSVPINPVTLSSGAVSLAFNGGPNLISGPLAVSLVAGTTSTYQISGLAALTGNQGTYVLTVHAAAVSNPGGPGIGTSSVTWVMDTTAPDSNVAALPETETSLSFPVTAVGDDPGPAPNVATSGLVACDLYVSTNGGRFVYWTTVHPWAPTAIFTGAPGNSYAFHSIGHDAAGNFEVKGQLVETSTKVADLTPPVTRVMAVNTQSATFQVTISGSDQGGSGLAYTLVFVEVDGGAPHQIGQLTTNSGTIPYQAIADGHAHTYRFYSQGVDVAGNIQAPPSAAGDGLTVMAKFKVPSSLQPTALWVQNGGANHSGIETVELMFNKNAGLSRLVAHHGIKLIEHGVNGRASKPISLKSVLHVVDHAIELEFGAAGLGGNPESATGEGYYELDVPLNHKVYRYFF